MWSWFGGGSAQNRKDSPKNAILRLRSQLDMLQKREKHIQSQIDEQQGVARKNANTNKNAAMAALRRKKQHEATLEKTLAQIGTLETQINSIESANINHETLLAMEQAGKAMKQIHGKLTPEKVDETMSVTLPNRFLGLYHYYVAFNADWTPNTGRSFRSKTSSARKSSTRSSQTMWAPQSTRTSWKQSWTIYSKRSWTRISSRRGRYLLRMSYTRCRRRRTQNVSANYPDGLFVSNANMRT